MDGRTLFRRFDDASNDGFCNDLQLNLIGVLESLDEVIDEALAQFRLPLEGVGKRGFVGRGGGQVKKREKTRAQVGFRQILGGQQSPAFLLRERDEKRKQKDRGGQRCVLEQLSHFHF